jgi:DnaJ-class molecular chaperone
VTRILRVITLLATAFCLWVTVTCGRLQDLVFVVEQIPDNTYERQGDDLVVRARIPLAMALTDSKVRVSFLCLSRVSRGRVTKGLAL